MITYDSRVGQFRGDNGRFVPRATVLRQITETRTALSERLGYLSKLLVNKKISLADWQSRTIDTIKEANIRMMILSAGGKRNVTKAHYGSMGTRLRNEWSRLDSFANDIRLGRLSSDQIIARSKLYAQSSTSAFFNGERLTKTTEGFRYAKRWLDAGAKHCSQCPDYSTGGLWVNIADVILPGHLCDCRGNCKCGISYKK